MEKLQILQAVNDIARVAMAPEYDRTIGLRVNIPPEQTRPIGGLKPHLFKWQAGQPRPVAILPGIRMIDEKSIEETHSSFGQVGFAVGSERPSDAAGYDMGLEIELDPLIAGAITVPTILGRKILVLPKQKQLLRDEGADAAEKLVGEGEIS